MMVVFSTAFAAVGPISGLEAAPVDSAAWKTRHEQEVRQVRARSVRRVFLGDSITEGWLGAGRRVWDEHFAPRGVLNAGIGGDKVENVLWRVQHGALSSTAPLEQVVLLIGTNNLWRDSVETVAQTTAATIQAIRQRQPRARILLLAVLPRSDAGAASYRAKIPELNLRLRELARRDELAFLDLGSALGDGQGGLSPRLSSDGLHLNESGYRIFGDGLLPML